MMRLSVVALVMMVLAACGGETSSGGEDGVAAHPGGLTYTRFCFSCHAAGIAGAPRTGDAVAWAPRIAKGREALLITTIEGVPPGMPPRGLCARCTDEELADAVDYMIQLSQ
jgi:cytochrome c5